MPTPTGPVVIDDLAPERRRLPLRAPATVFAAAVLLAVLTIVDIVSMVAWWRGDVIVSSIDTTPLTAMAGFRSATLLFAAFPAVALLRSSLLARSWVFVLSASAFVLIGAEVSAVLWVFNSTLDILSNAEQMVLLFDAIAIPLVAGLLLTPSAALGFDLSESLRHIEQMRETGQLRALEYSAAQAVVLNHAPLTAVRFGVAANGQAQTAGGHFTWIGDEWIPTELLNRQEPQSRRP